MAIKLVAVIYLEIKYINIYLMHNPKDNRSIFLQAFFGKLKCVDNHKNDTQELRST